MGRLRKKKNTNNGVTKNSYYLDTEPEKIVYASFDRNKGTINYELQWKDADTVVTFTSEIVMNKWPHLLIQYLESIIKWAKKKNTNNGVTKNLYFLDTEPEKIVYTSCCNRHGTINYKLKWKDADTVVTFTSEVVKNRWPHLLIRYLESISEWAEK